MKVKYTMSKGKRVKNYGFYTISAYTKDGKTMWHDHINDIWAETFKYMDMFGTTSDYSIKSVKSAIRHIKKWNVEKGTKFVLKSIFVNCDVTIIK